MPVRFQYDITGWRPSWAEMVEMVERVCNGVETGEELRWLRSHPPDWLMAARYVRVRAESQVAEIRRALVNDLGSLNAEAATDNLNGRRAIWMARLDEQVNEATYILKKEQIPNQGRAALVDRLLAVRSALISDTRAALGIVEELIGTYAESFETDTESCD